MRFVNADGLIWISDWNALQHPVASAFLAVVYSDYMLSSRTAKISCDGNNYRPSDLRKFALSQVHFNLRQKLNLMTRDAFQKAPCDMHSHCKTTSGIPLIYSNLAIATIAKSKAIMISLKKGRLNVKVIVN